MIPAASRRVCLRPLGLAARRAWSSTPAPAWHRANAATSSTAAVSRGRSYVPVRSSSTRSFGGAFAGDSESSSGGGGRCASAATLAATLSAAVAATASVSTGTSCDEGHKTARHDTTFVASQQHLVIPSDYNPTPTTVPPPIAGLSAHNLRHKNVAAFIGLPLRGKGHMARRLKLYLEFFHGCEVEIFDVLNFIGSDGDERLLEALREFFAQTSDGKSEVSDEKHVSSGRFAILWPSETTSVQSSMWSGHSKWRRRWMSQALEKEIGAQLCFIEIKVDDSDPEGHRQAYIEALARLRGIGTDELKRQVRDYLFHFTTIQEDGTEDDLQYMKLINYNQKVVTNRMMRSFLGTRMAQFLASVHPYKHTVYLTRHGQSQYNVEKKIGGDSSLSPSGRMYARRVGEFAHYVVSGQAETMACVDISGIEAAEVLPKMLTEVQTMSGMVAKGNWSDIGLGSGSEVREGMQLVRMQSSPEAPFYDAPRTIQEVIDAIGTGSATLVFINAAPMMPVEQCRARLWTSSMRRTKETAEHIRHPLLKMPDGKVWEQMAHRVYRNLDEVYAGEYEGLTYQEIKKKQPIEAELRKLDKLGYRYPRGESYYDLIARLDFPIQTLEHVEEPLLVVSHQAVLRLVYAFLMGIPREKAIELDIPLHTVIKIEWDGTGSKPTATRFRLGPSSESISADGQSHFMRHPLHGPSS